MNRPWTIWWDFTWEIDETGPSHVIVQTDHPDYQYVRFIHHFPMSDIEDDAGCIDSWVETWFLPFRDDVVSGRKSIHDLMKNLGYKKEKNDRRRKTNSPC
jgi:hypothetical protein